MKIFALETNVDVFKKNFLHDEEREIITIYNHGFKFFMALVRMTLLTVPLFALGIGAAYIGVDAWIATGVTAVIWLLTIFPRLIMAFIDWQYDFTFVTTDKVVLVDQSSIIRQRVTPINLENFASVAAETQLMNIFPFGKLRFHLKGGLGEDLVLPYIGHAQEIASKIANVVTDFQRRKDLRRYGEGGTGTLQT